MELVIHNIINKVLSLMTRFDILYMDIAVRISQMSYDEQTKVGCIIVDDKNIISYGYNGTPSGLCNKTRDKQGITLPSVIHAEANAVAKCNITKSNNLTAYCTLSPCYSCANLLLQFGVTRVVYKDVYKVDTTSYLKELGIITEHYKVKNIGL